MANKKIKKPRPKRPIFGVLFFLVVGAVLFLWWARPYLYNIQPQFHYILIEKNGRPLKVLNKEALQLHPADKFKILKISTNLWLNRGIRLTAGRFDVNALIYEQKILSTLLPDEAIYNRNNFRIKVKQFNQELGYVDIVVEPHVEDWIQKADRIIDRTRRIAVLEKALKLTQDNKKIKGRLLNEYRSLKKWGIVARMLEKEARKKPDEKLLYDLLEVYESMSKIDGITSVLRRLLEKNPDNMEVRFKLGSILEKSGKLKEAVKEYEILLKIVDKKDMLGLYKTLGYLYTETGRARKAIAIYLKAVEIDKKDVNLFYNLSTLYEGSNRKDKANFYLSKAVSLKPGDMEGRLKLAESLIQKGKLKDAEQHINEALKKKPDSIAALSLAVRVFEKQGDKKGLKKIYHKLISLDRKNETINYNLGVLEYETGNFSASLKYFKYLVKKNRKDADLHRFLFDIYRKQKKNSLAFKEATVLITMKPKDIHYYHFIFEYLNSHNDYPQIIQFMKKGLKSNPGNIDLKRYLVLAYLKTGKVNFAVSQIKEILKAGPKDLTLLIQLARLEEKQGKFKDALNTYKKILDVSPGHEESEEAYIRLRLRVLPDETK